MIKRTVTFPIVTAALALLVFATLTAARAQGYEGVVAEDGGDIYSDTGEISDEMREVYNYGDGQGPADVFKPDYFKNKAEQKKANAKSYREQAAAEREAAQAAREEEWKATEQAIDARVEAAVSAPSDYGTRIDGLKAPPPQMPETQPPETQPVVQPTPGTGTGSGGSGSAGGSGGAAAGGDRGGSVMERMMNEQLQ